MSTLLEQVAQANDSTYDVQFYFAKAAALSKELAASAVERDRIAGIPHLEIQKLREAGLLPLLVPHAYGGIGATWVEGLRIVRELSKADGSTGQLYANQLILSTLGQVAGTSAQAERFYRATAQQHLFWGNAVNTRDNRLKIVPEGDYLRDGKAERYRVNGVKSFGTGVVVADMRVFSAMQDGGEFPVFFVVPKDREGIHYNEDWDNMGQRRTASGSVTFHNVLVTSDEILGPPPFPESGFATLLFVVNQLAKTHVYLGIAEGAFEAVQQYTTTHTRPWLASGVERGSQDPYILHHYGELWTQLQATIALADRAAQQVQVAWDKGWKLSPVERGEVAIPIYAARACATKVGLDLTTQIFTVMGARSTAAIYGFDRYWRDLRTFTLHDPVDYKLRDIGNWVLNHELPVATQYS
jgi:alkylation response protein AidB-like acyl-CoA dehydrogenase